MSAYAHGVKSEISHDNGSKKQSMPEMITEHKFRSGLVPKFAF